MVVVTGGTAGIGRAAVQAFARHGDDVAILARGDAGLAGAAAEVEAAGRRALPLAVDVADPGAVEEAAAAVEAALGPIDVWVNNAFSSVFAPFEEIAPEEFRRLTEVSYLGYVWGTRAALARMKARGSGTIVQVGSALAYRGIPLQSGYCGAKHAIQGFTESVRAELMHDHSPVQITMVQMPAVNTPQFDWVLSRLGRHPQPVPPIYQPEVAARAVVHAADHPERREYQVGSITVATLMANKVAAGLLDRYLGRTGFDSQQTSELARPDRPANLWQPVDADHDHGAHGSFDSKAHPTSAQWWLDTHRTLLGATGTAAAFAAVAVGRRWSR